MIIWATVHAIATGGLGLRFEVEVFVVVFGRWIVRGRLWAPAKACNI